MCIHFSASGQLAGWHYILIHTPYHNAGLMQHATPRVKTNQFTLWLSLSYESILNCYLSALHYQCWHVVPERHSYFRNINCYFLEKKKIVFSPKLTWAVTVFKCHSTILHSLPKIWINLRFKLLL